MRSISCLVLPIRDHAFFEQTVFEGQFGHNLLQGAGLAAQILHLVRGRGPRRIASQPLLSRLRESPSTSDNKDSGQSPHGGKALRCSPRRAGPPARYGSFLRPRISAASCGGCPSRSFPPVPSPARISVSSSLLERLR